MCSLICYMSDYPHLASAGNLPDEARLVRISHSLLIPEIYQARQSCGEYPTACRGEAYSAQIFLSGTVGVVQRFVGDFGIVHISRYSIVIFKGLYALFSCFSQQASVKKFFRYFNMRFFSAHEIIYRCCLHHESRCGRLVSDKFMEGGCLVYFDLHFIRTV